MRGSQLLRFIFSILWCMASVGLGVLCCFVGGWIFNLFAFALALSAVVSYYVLKEEWKYL